MAWQQPRPPQQGSATAYDEFGMQAGVQRPAGPGVPPFNSGFYGAGSDFIRTGLGAYGERIFGTGREYVQSNISRYLSGHDAQYYFQVNDQYVKNKLKVILCPFLHRGHWARIAEQVAGGLTYKPPRYDINAPDLYIPFMAFGTYVILTGIALGLLGKFSPEALGLQFTKGLFSWAAQVLLIRVSLYALGSSDAPILDILAYGGYAFIGVSISILARILWSYSYYLIMPWTSLCMAVFLVKTMKRILFAEARSYDRDSSKHHYLLLFIAVAQFPLSFWLGYINT
eukprot:c20888_g1_i1 orf=86-937(+)